MTNVGVLHGTKKTCLHAHKNEQQRDFMQQRPFRCDLTLLYYDKIKPNVDLLVQNEGGSVMQPFC